MNIRKYLILFLLTISCAAPVLAQTVDDNSDIVAWSDATFIVPLRKKDENGKRVDEWTLNLGGVFRYGRNLKRPIDERGTVGLNYRLNKYFTVGSTYVYRRFRPTEARAQYEHRLLFHLLAEKKWTRVTLRNRAMTTYYIRHSRPDSVAYRNRVQVSFPVKKDGKELFAPFVADEPFYDFREKKWFRNDFFAGVSKQFTPKFGADFFYLRQGFKLGTLRRTNGFGVSFRYRLDFIK
jgi:hypothetical protein